MDLLLNHSTIRKFLSQTISNELLELILSSGVRASTTGNMQLYSIVVSHEKDSIQKLAALHFNQPVALKAPLILTFCADIHRFNAWCTQRETIAGFNNYISFFTAAIDALLVAQNVCIAAENYGLGICYLGTATYNASEIIELLSLPQGVVPVTAVALGWPDEHPDQVDRLPLAAVVHNDNYQVATPTLINEWYSYKESLASSQKFVAENHKQTLAQVFTDVRYTRQNNESFSEKFWNTICKHWPIE